MKTKIALFITLLAYTATGQNLMNNGTMDADLNSDGLADGWYVDNGTTATLTGGWQHLTATNTCEFGQVVDLSEPAGKTYRIRYDIDSDSPTQLRIFMTDGYSFMVNQPNPQPVGLHHYDYTFYFFQSTFAALQFRTIYGNSWMKIDNVILTEVYPVGLPEPITPDWIPVEYYDMLGRQIPQAPDRGIWIERRSGVTVKKSRP